MQTPQDFDSGPTSNIHATHTDNASFVKTADTSIVYWLQYITYVLLDVILHNNLFHCANLCIPRTHLPTSLKDFCLDIISHCLPTSWTFHMQLSHTINYR